MKELLESMVKAIVDSPDDVKIDTTESENTLIYELRLGDGDLGKVIGKRGKNIGAIRTLISAATAKEGGKRSIIEIIESDMSEKVLRRFRVFMFCKLVDIYGKVIEVKFIKRIRDERKFEDLQGLKKQLLIDKNRVIQILV